MRRSSTGAPAARDQDATIATEIADLSGQTSANAPFIRHGVGAKPVGVVLTSSALLGRSLRSRPLRSNQDGHGDAADEKDRGQKMFLVRCTRLVVHCRDLTEQTFSPSIFCAASSRVLAMAWFLTEAT